MRTQALLILLALAACDDTAPVGVLGLEVEIPRVELSMVAPAPDAPEPATAHERPRASLDVPDRCDRLVVVDTPSGQQLDKERPAWLRKTATRTAHQREIRRVISFIGEELGADEVAVEMVWRKSIYESSGNERNVHVTTKDVAANRRAARKGRRRSSERWARATVATYQRHRGGLRELGAYDAWALGRGLYGQVSGLHMHRWSTDAPPWSLCDPIIATVTVFWAMRAGLRECHGETLRDAYRRFSSGMCAIRSPKLERRFDRLARGHVRGLRLGRFDPDAIAELGMRWPEETTDRGELLAVLQARVAQTTL